MLPAVLADMCRTLTIPSPDVKGFQQICLGVLYLHYLKTAYFKSPFHGESGHFFGSGNKVDLTRARTCDNPRGTVLWRQADGRLHYTQLQLMHSKRVHKASVEHHEVLLLFDYLLNLPYGHGPHVTGLCACYCNSNMSQASVHATVTQTCITTRHVECLEMCAGSRLYMNLPCFPFIVLLTNLC